MLSDPVRRGVERHLTWLDGEIGQADDDLDRMIRESPTWRADEDLLTSMPGVGRVLARTMIAEAPELGRFNRRQVALVARMRRIIVILNAMLKSRQPWALPQRTVG